MTTHNRGRLAADLTTLARTTGDGRLFPIMATVRLGGGHAVTTTNDTFASIAGPYDDAVAVDCRRLLDVVRALDGDEVQLKTDGQNVVVASGRATYRLNGLDAALFPDVPVAPPLGGVDDDWGATLELAGRLDTEHLGVQLAAYGGLLSLAATDYSRLVYRGGNWENAFVIRGTGLRALAGSGIRDVGVSDNWAFFGDGDATIVGVRRQATNYPDVDRVVANATANTVGTAHIDAKRLQDALGRVRLMVGESTRVGLKLAAGRLTLTAADDVGDAVDELPYEGDAVLEAAVNGKYLDDFTRYATGGVALAVGRGRGDALLWTTDALPDVKYVLMPMT